MSEDSKRALGVCALFALAALLLAGCIPSAQMAQNQCLHHDGVHGVIKTKRGYEIRCNDGIGFR